MRAAGPAARRTVDALQQRKADLLADLKACSLRRDLAWGRRIHAKAMESRNDTSMYVVTALIKMYARCSSMRDARRLFDSLQNPDVVSWTALLSGYADNGEGYTALEFFSRMKSHGCLPDSIAYVAALKACTALAADGCRKADCLRRGREVHSEIGCHLDQHLQNMLIDMYGKCGSMADARQVFESVQNPNVVSWNAILLGYAENREGYVTLDLFSRMRASQCTPDSITYIAAVKACTSLAADGVCKAECLKHGRAIHSEIGCDLNHYVQNTLIDMYSKCGSMVEAQDVFDSVQKPEVVAWNALLLGYAENGAGQVALDLFSRMKACRCSPNSVTYIAALKACTSLAVTRSDSECLELGRRIHIEVGSHLNLQVQNTLIDMYVKCGSMVDAQRVFESIQNPDVVSWTALNLGYAENRQGHVALELFSKMKSLGCVPDSVAYVAALKACISLGVNGEASRKAQCLERGKEIHAEIGGNLKLHLLNTLIDMYSKLGSMKDAHRVFESIKKPDVVSWNALLLGYVENGDGRAVLDLLSVMKAQGCVPDPVTYIAGLKACALTGALSLGRKLHSEISEFTAHVVTGLIDFYAKCGSMAEAREVFDSHSRTRNVPTWNAMLAGYSSFGVTDPAFDLFEAMKGEGFQPDAVTFVCMLLCCSHAGLVEKAREYFKALPVQYGVAPTLVHYTCMVDVLGRGNQLAEAIAVVRRMPCNPDGVIWTALLGACQKWKNVELGRVALESLVAMDKLCSSSHVLMAHISLRDVVEKRIKSAVSPDF